MPAPSLSYQLASAADAALFEHVAPDVFDNPLQPQRLVEHLADSRHHIAIALDATLNHQIVGFASGLHYVHPDKAPQFFIDEVGVAESHHRRGIATQLLQLLLEHAQSLGCEEAWVGTDPDNTPARSLYAGLAYEKEESTAILYTFKLGKSALGAQGSRGF